MGRRLKRVRVSLPVTIAPILDVTLPTRNKLYNTIKVDLHNKDDNAWCGYGENITCKMASL